MPSSSTTDDEDNEPKSYKKLIKTLKSKQKYTCYAYYFEQVRECKLFHHCTMEYIKDKPTEVARFGG